MHERAHYVFEERGEFKYISKGDGTEKNHYHMLSEDLVQAEFKVQVCHI